MFEEWVGGGGTSVFKMKLENVVIFMGSARCECVGGDVTVFNIIYYFSYCRDASVCVQIY